MAKGDFNSRTFFGSGGRAGKQFSDPFVLPSNGSFPTDLEAAYDFCRYLYFLVPQYRQASNRVVAHFITTVDFVGKRGSIEEREDLKRFLDEELDIWSAMLELGVEWACFSGDTVVNTEEGPYQIKNLVGRRVNVLSKDGVYRPADFKSYGVQPLMEVEFCDGRKIRATPEHEWEVRNGSGKIVTVTTEELRPSNHRIKRTVAPRPEKDDDYFEGVRHGFVYGDGSQNGNRTTAMFCGDKDRSMLPYFEGHGNGLIPRQDRKEMGRISGLPGHFKALPDPRASASYWYGFVCGFLAADGTVDTYGCAALARADRTVLEAVEAQLPRIGMVAGPIKSQIRDTEIGGREYRDHEMFSMTLLKQFMGPEDILLEAHKEKFDRHFNPDSKYGQWMRIQAVRDAYQEEEVFCCEEMETHRIVVGQGVLTAQCYGNGFVRLNMPFNRFLKDTRGKRTSIDLSIFREEDVKYDYRTMTFEVPDPRKLGKVHAGYRVPKVKLQFEDQSVKDRSRIRFHKLDPRYITPQGSRTGAPPRFIWRMEPKLIKSVRDGELWQVNDLQEPILRAIARDQDFRFAEDQVFHFKAPTLTGISENGLGVPEPIANYRNIHQLQVYRKIDEAVGLDYMLPFRYFTPEMGTNTTSATMDILLGPWRSEMQKMIGNRRTDPFSMYALPFAANYNEVGAEGKSLTPKELMEFQVNDLLDSIGYPAELFRGSLQVQQIPTAVRLFENSFRFIPRGMDRFLKWTVRQSMRHLGQEPLDVRLQSPKIATDLENKHIYMQLTASQELSRKTSWSQIGIEEPVEEVVSRAEEEAEIQKELAKIQADSEREMNAGSVEGIVAQQQAAAGGGGMGAPGGGAPAVGAGGNPLKMQEDAMAIAQEIIAQNDPSYTRQRLAELADNQNLVALVEKAMKEMRAQAESEGRASLPQQLQGGM